jgi:monoamine oxidase
MKTILSRRHFLNLVGAAGGSTAVYQTSMALGLIQESGPMAKPNLQYISGRQKRVAIPGAGLSGLTIANELERAGYDVTANG